MCFAFKNIISTAKRTNVLVHNIFMNYNIIIIRNNYLLNNIQ